MTGAESSDRFETGHVLFTNIVGSSRLLNEEQKERVEQLVYEDADCEIVSVYALRAEPEKVSEWLEQASTARESGVIDMQSDPFPRAYSDDIAFAQKIEVTPNGGDVFFEKIVADQPPKEAK